MSTPANNLPTPTPSLSAAEIKDIIRNMMSQGDADTRAATLMSENFQYRDKIRGLEAVIADLKTKAAPDGSVILNVEDAKTYQDFKALNIKPADITTMKAENDRLKTESEGLQRKMKIEAAAKAEGYDSTVLGTLLNGQELTVKSVNEEVDGVTKAVDHAFIQTKGADNVITEKRLTEHVEQNFAKFIPSLKIEAEAANTGSANTGGGGAATGGTPFVAQRATGAKGATPDPSKAYIAKKYGTRKPEKAT